MKILIAYDGTLNSKTALRYGINKIKEKGGEALLLHVFPARMFIDYDATAGARETAKAEHMRYLEAAEEIIREAGADRAVRIISVEGVTEEEIIRYAEAEDAGLILCPPRYKSIIKKSPCPVSLIPGNILLPVDCTDSAGAVLPQAIKEALATGSRVVLLGVVPVHLYGIFERRELQKVKKETSMSLKRIKKTLTSAGIKAEEVMRSGYPDEEILKAAAEYSASMIILPPEGETPSELSKAGSIIADALGRIKSPVVLAEAGA